MNNTERDRSVEALLRRRSDESVPPTDECLDAESLAAWMEGGLAAASRAALEKHAAGCARCQALLASIARTEPEVEPRRWWQSVTAKWLVPVAAVATALVVWTSVGRLMPSPLQEQQPADTARASSEPEPQRPRPTQAPAAGSSERASASTQSPQAKVGSRDRDPRGRAEHERADRSKEEMRRAAPQPKQLADSLGGVAEKSVDTVPEGQAADAAAKVAAPVASLPVATPPAGPPTPASPATQVRSAEAKPAAPSTVAESIPLDQVARAPVMAGRGQAFGGVAGVGLEIQSPDPMYRWRLVAPARVQRSTDGGATWAVVDPLPASMRGSNGSAGVLTAGHAPTRSVCWIVGRAGLVLLSTDGATWRRRPFPETIDLVAVRASTATNAIVTTVDGRQFASTDGGATWVPVK